MGNQESSVGRADTTSSPTPSGRERILGDGTFQATRGTVTAGFIIEDGRVTTTAPILWMIGRWPASQVYKHLRTRGWEIIHV